VVPEDHDFTDFFQQSTNKHPQLLRLVAVLSARGGCGGVAVVSGLQEHSSCSK
jgi:hypothetical protein